MARKFDPVKAKAKRDKILAGALGGILLVVAIFSIPMTLRYWKKVNGGDQAAQVATPAATPPAPVTSVPTLPSGSLGGTVSAPISISELRAFDLFQSKDPFKQQVDIDDPGVSASSPPAPASPPPPASTPGESTPFVPGPAGTASPALPPTGAVVSVNGRPAELLGVGVDFPLPPAEPLFHLHSLAKGLIRISIVGGSYADGSKTVPVRVGKPLTFENTADGTRYEVRVLWVGAGAPPAGLVPAPPATTPSATPSTPPPPSAP